MNNDNSDIEILIAHRLEQAKEAINDVQLLIENERLAAAINRIYYGIFYTLLALGLANKFETSKHAQLLGWFNKNFVHKGLVDKHYGRIAYKAFTWRTKGDYDAYVEFD